MQTETTMFAMRLINAGHVHRFVIDVIGTEGWDVREERDNQIVRHSRYTDWHRVERARDLFAVRASLLTDSGWTEA